MTGRNFWCLYPVAEADFQRVELQFASKWIGLISSWCNRKHLLPYLNICKKCIHLAVTFSHTERKKPHNLRRWEHSESFSTLYCVFTVPPGKGPELLPQRQLGFWPLKQVDGSCAVQQCQGGNSSSSERAITGGQEPGTPGLALLLCCSLSCFVSLYFCKLKEEVGLIWQATLCKKWMLSFSCFLHQRGFK